MVKAATLLLVTIALLAMFSGLRRRVLRWLRPRQRNAQCRACGRPQIGAGPCACRGGQG